MDKDSLPETSDKDHLEKRPDGDKDYEQTIEGKGGALNGFCKQTPDAG